jgi:hypothetical protein
MTFLKVKRPFFEVDFSKSEELEKQKIADEKFVLEAAWMDICLVSWF